jgi:adenylate cyclase
MDFRIGISLGDVIEEGEQIYGDGVNIAARVEGLTLRKFDPIMLRYKVN